nr:FAD-dependent oxidoreductase [Amycolatopsis sp. FDAARGOS 1241]
MKQDITIADLMARTQRVAGREVQVVRGRLLRNHLDLVPGTGSFADPHTVLVEGKHPGDRTMITGDPVVIATGTRPARPHHVDFDAARVLDSDEILRPEEIPSSLVVVGAGVIGIGYASLFAALGSRVTVVEQRDQMLDFRDPEIVESLKFHLRDLASRSASARRSPTAPCHRGLPGGRRVQLPDALGGVRGRHPGHDEQDQGHRTNSRSDVSVRTPV